MRFTMSGALSLRYSSRNASVGSTSDARRAGRYVAMSEMAAIATAEPVKTSTGAALAS